MIHVTPFKAHHAFGIHPFVDRQFIKQMYDREGEEGTAITVWHDGRVLFCGGISKLWDGVGAVWMVVSETARKKPVTLTRTAKRYMASIIEQYGFDRVHAFIACDNETDIRFAERMGLKRESGRLEKYYGGKDFYLYAIVRR